MGPCGGDAQRVAPWRRGVWMLRGWLHGDVG